MASKNKCWLCLRITPKDLRKGAYALFPDKQARLVFTKAVEYVRLSYEKNRIIFCSKTKGRIIGGLLYVLGYKYAEAYRPTQKEVAMILTQLNFGCVVEPTIRAGKEDWAKLFPELKVSRKPRKYPKRKTFERKPCFGNDEVYGTSCANCMFLKACAYEIWGIDTGVVFT